MQLSEIKKVVPLHLADFFALLLKYHSPTAIHLLTTTFWPLFAKDRILDFFLLFLWLLTMITTSSSSPTLWSWFAKDPILDWTFIRFGDGACPTTTLFIGTGKTFLQNEMYYKMNYKRFRELEMNISLCHPFKLFRTLIVVVFDVSDRVIIGQNWKYWWSRCELWACI